MSDFTKEELNTLYDYVYNDINDGSGYSFVTNYHDNLLDKLKKMIDNYCEHETTLNYDSINVARKYKCKKCGGFFE